MGQIRVLGGARSVICEMLYYTLDKGFWPNFMKIGRKCQNIRKSASSFAFSLDLYNRSQ